MERFLDVDLRSLALLRASLGLLVIYDLACRSADLSLFYTDAGALPRSILTKHLWNSSWFSLHILSGGLGAQLCLFTLHGLCALALMLGWRTRLSSAGCYLLTVSLHNRMPMVLDSSDRLLGLLLFWGLFLPWESRWSLDARRCPGRYAGTNTVCLPGTTGYILQIVQLYLMAGYWKLHPVWLTEFSGAYRSLKLTQFANPFGVWLLGFPFLLKVLTLSTVLLELFGPLVVLLSGNTVKRLIALACFASFHVGLGLALDLEFFPLVSIVALTGLLPSCAWGKTTASAGPESLPEGVRWSASGLVSLLAGIAASFTMVWNLMMAFGGGEMPPALRNRCQLWIKAMEATRLVQYWNLFSPIPRDIDSWYIVEAQLADGSIIDLSDGGPVSFQASPLPSRDFPSQRHRTFYSVLEQKAGAPMRRPFLMAIAAQWDAAHPEKPVRWLRFVSVRSQVRLDDTISPTFLVEVCQAFPGSPEISSRWRRPPVLSTLGNQIPADSHVLRPPTKSLP